MIILDFGSGNTCRNEGATAQRMIDALIAIHPPKSQWIIKWQLFKKAGNNVPLDQNIFWRAYNYAGELGFRTTASVFDLESLRFLLYPRFDNLPFIKVANNRRLDWLVGEIPRKIPVYTSYKNSKQMPSFRDIPQNDRSLCCVSEYPASKESYERHFTKSELKRGISDHTTDWTLYRKYKPKIYEVHFKLPDSTGPDAGPFARTPEQLKEIL